MTHKARETLQPSKILRERDVPQLMRERERVCFWLPRGYGKSGEVNSSMNQCVVELSCQAMALCVCRVKREELQAHHESCE